MALRRLELPDGQWADLLVKPRHADWLAIIEAAEEADQGRSSNARALVAIGRTYCRAWNVRDPETGAPLDVADWSAADPDITDAICTEAFARWKEWDTSRVPLVMPWWKRQLAKLAVPATSSPDSSEARPSE